MDFGAFITSIIYFVIVAAAIYFFVVVPINKLRGVGAQRGRGRARRGAGRRRAAAEIRDLLRTRT